jgi:putative glycerol-1-phosphate prenyltransferase
MKKELYINLVERKRRGRKSFAVLLDPDKTRTSQIPQLAEAAAEAGVDYWLVGGSLMVSTHLDQLLEKLKKHSPLPVILFPGSPAQVNPRADALLYLSLISGRNPELLIGQHVVSAPLVKQSGLEILPTGYMVIDGGAPTTVSYISNALPIPSDKWEIALCTAMAGEMLGMKLIYMDAGSGARNPVTESMIEAVSTEVSLPLIVGGGIREPEKAYLNCKAGADLVVVGNILETQPALMRDMAAAVHSATPVSMGIEITNSSSL